jgi:hypothetical protein
VTLSNSSIITIASGASTGTVSVAARTDDSYDQGTSTVTASITNATGGNFETLTASGGAASTTVVDDEGRDQREPDGERRRHGRAVDHLHRDPGRGGAGARCW